MDISPEPSEEKQFPAPQTRLSGGPDDAEEERKSVDEGEDLYEVSSNASEDPLYAEVNTSGKTSVSLFEPIPKCSWECARVRAQKGFIGHVRADKIYRIPSWWPDWIASIRTRQAETLVDGIIDPRYIYGESVITTEQEELPPEQEYVVLGIFDSDKRLCEEVVVYIGSPTKSYHLYHGQRHLFKLPWLRDIKSFGLYKCDEKGRSHVCIDLSAEDKDLLNSLFGTMKRWSKYHNLKDTLQKYWIESFALYFGVFMPLPLALLSVLNPVYLKLFGILYTNAFLEYYRMLGLLKSPEIEDEEAVCKWLQKNLNGGNKNPAAGKYSLKVVIGWSRRRILVFVVAPVILVLTAVTATTVVLSAMKGDLAWSGLANYCSGLAAAYVAMIGFVGGSAAYK